MDRIKAILDFWFEGVDDATPIDKKTFPFKKWFMQDHKLDAQICREFEADLLAAAAGKYTHWKDSSSGRLALIILFDQFTRNMYRNTAQMYAYDALALKMTLEAIGQGQEKELPLIRRIFLYMPLMHSEDLNLQKLSVEYFTKLAEESRAKVPENTHYYEYTLKYAREHHDTVAQSGRFPLRDAILNRGVR